MVPKSATSLPAVALAARNWPEPAQLLVNRYLYLDSSGKLEGFLRRIEEDPSTADKPIALTAILGEEEEGEEWGSIYDEYVMRVLRRCQNLQDLTIQIPRFEAWSEAWPEFIEPVQHRPTLRVYHGQFSDSIQTTLNKIDSYRQRPILDMLSSHRRTLASFQVRNSSDGGLGPYHAKMRFSSLSREERGVSIGITRRGETLHHRHHCAYLDECFLALFESTNSDGGRGLTVKALSFDSGFPDCEDDNDLAWGQEPLTSEFVKAFGGTLSRTSCAARVCRLEMAGHAQRTVFKAGDWRSIAVTLVVPIVITTYWMYFTKYLTRSNRSPSQIGRTESHLNDSPTQLARIPISPR